MGLIAAGCVIVVMTIFGLCMYAYFLYWKAKIVQGGDSRKRLVRLDRQYDDYIHNHFNEMKTSKSLTSSNDNKAKNSASQYSTSSLNSNDSSRKPVEF